MPVTPLFRRSPRNPILTAADWPYPVDAVFNPAATIDNGETVLVCRVEDRRGLSHLGVARSADGVQHWRVEAHPLLAPQQSDPSCQLGVEDPRVTRVDELGGWVIAHTAVGREGPSVALAFTTDFQTASPLGVAMSPDDKNAALLPRRVGDEFVLFHRPRAAGPKAANIWLSNSPDLHSWTAPHPVLQTRDWPWWDSIRIGMGPPPIDTPAGWLTLYHGVKNQVNGVIYRAGLLLLDHDDPTQVRRRSEDWILSPVAPYELTGNTPNVVFPTGLIHDIQADQLRLYYGAADSCVALATASFSDVLEYLMALPEPS